MPKCPKCGKEVDQLKARVSEVSDWLLMLEDGDPYWEEEDRTRTGDITFGCPECEAVLFQDEEKALAFLRLVD